MFIETLRDRGVTNVLQGLELHVPVLSRTEQVMMEENITNWVQLGTQVSIFPSFKFRPSLISKDRSPCLKIQRLPMISCSCKYSAIEQAS